jgi:hypothetical protein
MVCLLKIVKVAKLPKIAKPPVHLRVPPAKLLITICLLKMMEIATPILHLTASAYQSRVKPPNHLSRVKPPTNQIKVKPSMHQSRVRRIPTMERNS